MVQLHEGILKAVLTFLIGYEDAQDVLRYEHMELINSGYVATYSKTPSLPMNRLIAGEFKDLREKLARLIGLNAIAGCTDYSRSNEENILLKQKHLRYLMRLVVLMAGRDLKGGFDPNALIGSLRDSEYEAESNFLYTQLD